jgi:hypothetical protein
MGSGSASLEVRSKGKFRHSFLLALQLLRGIALLEQLARDNRIRIRQPKRNMQKKIVHSLSNGNEFVAYVDAIGHLDGTRRLLEWKATSAG